MSSHETETLFIILFFLDECPESQVITTAGINT